MFLDPFSNRTFALAWMTPVVIVSAGPPSGGLYLNPPSSGGLCEGVMTTPSANPLFLPRLYVRIACEMTGVGV